MIARGTPLAIVLGPVLSIPPIALFLALGHPFLLVLAALVLIVSLALLSFFRDPPRTIAEGMVSPADGRVIGATMHGRRTKVIVFMNVHNVHVNRSPVEGTVSEVRRVPGGFVPAFRKDSDRNERVITKLRTKYGRVIVTQIAGTVARRIVPYVREGDVLSKGERFGLIRFGSRVDIEFDMPPGWELAVREGDRVRSGSSSIALKGGGAV